MDIMKKYGKAWGVTSYTMQNYIIEATQCLYDDSMKESLKNINMLRLDQIFSDAMHTSDRKSAIKAIDTQNKMIGAYEQKVVVDTENTIDVNFNF